MKLRWISVFALVGMLGLLLPVASYAQVHDNAKIFSKDAVDQANQDMKRIEKKHGKQFVVETFTAVPDEQKAAAKENTKEVFRKWMASRAKDLKVNGVYVLICMDPRYVEAGAGTNTVKRGDFTEDNIDDLRKQMQSDLHDKEYDKALSNSVEAVENDFAANIHEPVNRAAARDSEYSYGRYRPVNTYNAPSYAAPQSSSGNGGLLTGFGSLICFAVAVVIIISLIRSIFRGGSGGGFGGNYGNQGYTGGNYVGGNYGGGYGGGGGFAGQGGSGFGKGFLGGLLGGALGGYAAEKFEHRNDQSNTGFFGGDSSPQQTDYSTGGSSSFDSGPSDAGGGFGDTSSGGDFGGGGGDSGGGGGDSGGSF